MEPSAEGGRAAEAPAAAAMEVAAMVAEAPEAEMGVATVEAAMVGMVAEACMKSLSKQDQSHSHKRIHHSMSSPPPHYTDACPEHGTRERRQHTSPTQG